MAALHENIIFHIDVNSAYLSWSALKRLDAGDPVDLRTIPSIVGGDMESRHGIVLAKSIPAKKYGITTGEPVVNALRKCPSLTMEPPDHQLYHQRSGELMSFLSGICPEIEQLSVDECFMNCTPVSHLYDHNPQALATSIKDAVREKFGYTVNIGISDKKVLAKMASDFQKPDRVHTLFTSQIQEKMWPLPVSSLYMCGKSSEKTLEKLGIRTIGELARTDREILSAHLKSHGVLLWEYANGIDTSTVNSTPAEAKGVGNSITLPHDVTSQQEAFHYLLTLADSVAGRLRQAGQLAGMVSVEIKYSSFQSVSHQKILRTASNTSDAIYQSACQLFQELWNGSPIRLLGIRTTKLSDNAEPSQLSLFDYEAVDYKAVASDAAAPAKAAPSAQKLAALDKTLDSIRKKYGDSAVIRGSLLDANSPKD